MYEKHQKNYTCGTYWLFFNLNKAKLNNFLSNFETQFFGCSSLGKNVGNGCESYDFRLIRLISKKRKPRQPSTNHHSSKYSESNREEILEKKKKGLLLSVRL